MMKYDSAIQRNELLMPGTPWMHKKTSYVKLKKPNANMQDFTHAQFQNK